FSHQKVMSVIVTTLTFARVGKFQIWTTRSRFFLSHPAVFDGAVFEHHHLDAKVSIFISKKCLLIDFLSVPAASAPGILPASGHVILVESEVELDLVLIRSDIYFSLADNFVLTFSLQPRVPSLSLSAS